jgi:hypothetical protein
MSGRIVDALGDPVIRGNLEQSLVRLSTLNVDHGDGLSVALFLGANDAEDDCA